MQSAYIQLFEGTDFGKGSFGGLVQVVPIIATKVAITRPNNATFLAAKKFAAPFATTFIHHLLSFFLHLWTHSPNQTTTFYLHQENLQQNILIASLQKVGSRIAQHHLWPTKQCILNTNCDKESCTVFPFTGNQTTPMWCCKCNVWLHVNDIT